jgi:hypothetical protein
MNPLAANLHCPYAVKRQPIPGSQFTCNVLLLRAVVCCCRCRMHRHALGTRIRGCPFKTTIVIEFDAIQTLKSR